MDETHRSPPAPKPKMWAYGYELSPSIAREKLEEIEKLVEEMQGHAKRIARTWEGRLIVDEQVSHILVVSDTPDRDLEINRKLEAELQRLEAPFSVTTPLPLNARLGPAHPLPDPPPGPDH